MALAVQIKLGGPVVTVQNKTKSTAGHVRTLSRQTMHTHMIASEGGASVQGGFQKQVCSSLASLSYQLARGCTGPRLGVHIVHAYRA